MTKGRDEMLMKIRMEMRKLRKVMDRDMAKQWSPCSKKKIDVLMVGLSEEQEEECA